MQDDGSAANWRQLSLGGGGYITGVAQDPLVPETFYARCDVAGLFRSRDGGRSWRPINAGLRGPHDHNVQTLAVDPHNAGHLVRCSGDLRGDGPRGSMHLSADSGETWRRVDSALGFFGNGPTRMYGESACFDPATPGRIAVGGYTGGVAMSSDGGASLRGIGLEDERIGCLAFHQGALYAGTLSASVLLGKGAPASSAAEAAARYGDSERTRIGAIYRFDEETGTWQRRFEGADIGSLVSHGGALIAGRVDGGPAVSRDGGRKWEPASGFPSGLRCNWVTADSAGRLYAAFAANQFRRQSPVLVPIYTSEDGGAHWEPLAGGREPRFIDYPDYITPAHLGSALSSVIVDRRDDRRLLMSNWYGVSVSEDGGETWCGNGFRGLETTCCEEVNAAVVGCTPMVWVTIADHPPIVSTDCRSFHSMNRVDHYPNSTASVVNHCGELLFGMRNRDLTVNDAALCRGSLEDGESALIMRFVKGSFVRGLVRDVHHRARLWMLVDGRLDDQAGLWRSDDDGLNWAHLLLAPATAWETIPRDAHWVEAELLPVVGYQVKNVCGSNAHLRVDPFASDTLYLGDYTAGIFRSDDAGATWTRADNGLPFDRAQPLVVDQSEVNRAETTRSDTRGTRPPGAAGMPPAASATHGPGAERFAGTPRVALAGIEVSPHEPGTLFAGFIGGGLWRSDDRGGSWRKLYPTSGVPFNASAIAVDQDDSRRIAAACEPLYWAPAPSAVVLSGDGGESFVEITPREYGALRWKGLAFARCTADAPELVGVTCGNGVLACGLRSS